jgi:hypothetical protein
MFYLTIASTSGCANLCFKYASHCNPHIAQVRYFLRRVRLQILTHVFHSLQGSDSGIPHHPVFSRKEAEEWCKSKNAVVLLKLTGSSSILSGSSHQTSQIIDQPPRRGAGAFADQTTVSSHVVL